MTSYKSFKEHEGNFDDYASQEVHHCYWWLNLFNRHNWKPSETARRYLGPGFILAESFKSGELHAK